MLFGTIRITPRFGGTFNETNATAAKTMPSVKKIVIQDNGFGIIVTNTWLTMQALKQ